VTCCFRYDVCGWSLSARRDKAKLVCDSFSFNGSTAVAAFPIADVPSIPYSDDLTVLLAVSHIDVLFRSF